MGASAAVLVAESSRGWEGLNCRNGLLRAPFPSEMAADALRRGENWERRASARAGSVCAPVAAPCAVGAGELRWALEWTSACEGIGAEVREGAEGGFWGDAAPVWKQLARGVGPDDDEASSGARRRYGLSPVQAGRSGATRSCWAKGNRWCATRRAGRGGGEVDGRRGGHAVTGAGRGWGRGNERNEQERAGRVSPLSPLSQNQGDMQERIAAERREAESLKEKIHTKKRSSAKTSSRAMVAEVDPLPRIIMKPRGSPSWVSPCRVVLMGARRSLPFAGRIRTDFLES
ncbi:hypothetical protein DFH09DRAFT_1087665 [Mycena vulgaris]|nr:hypothetical protein DFH09DRAFT_1087665 [Mycena vulgaris]